MKLFFYFVVIYKVKLRTFFFFLQIIKKRDCFNMYCKRTYNISFVIKYRGPSWGSMCIVVWHCNIVFWGIQNRCCIFAFTISVLLLLLSPCYLTILTRRQKGYREQRTTTTSVCMTQNLWRRVFLFVLSKMFIRI